MLPAIILQQLFNKNYPSCSSSSSIILATFHYPAAIFKSDPSSIFYLLSQDLAAILEPSQSSMFFFIFHDLDLLWRSSSHLWIGLMPYVLFHLPWSCLLPRTWQPSLGRINDPCSSSPSMILRYLEDLSAIAWSGQCSIFCLTFHYRAFLLGSCSHL